MLKTVTMPFIYPRHVLTPLRRGLIDFVRQVGANHHLTLNTHADYRLDTAISRLGSWYRHLSQRLFGRRWLERPKEEVIEFVAFPEYTAAGHPHFHCATRIPESHLDYFKRVAADRWSAVVPTSSLDLRPIKQTDADYEDLSRYVTKSSSARDVIHSSMLLLIR